MSADKVCKSCGEVKPLSAFYRHSQMADGHLNKCKECQKAYSNNYRDQNLDAVKAYDRERGRTAERKALVASRRPNYREKHRDYTKAWQTRNPEKRAAHIKVGNAVRDGKLIKQPCEVCGDVKVQAHHDDYGKPLEVRWLCQEHHGLTRRVPDTGDDAPAISAPSQVRTLMTSNTIPSPQPDPRQMRVNELSKLCWSLEAKVHQIDPSLQEIVKRMRPLIELLQEPALAPAERRQ